MQQPCLQWSWSVLFLILSAAYASWVAQAWSGQEQRYLVGCPEDTPVETPYRTFCKWSMARDGPNNVLGNYQGGAGQPIMGSKKRVSSQCSGNSNMSGYEAFCARWSSYDPSLEDPALSAGSCQCRTPAPNGKFCQEWSCVLIDSAQVAAAGAAQGRLDDGVDTVPHDRIFKFQNYTCLRPAVNGLFCASWAGNSLGGYEAPALALPPEMGSRTPYFRLYTCTATGSSCVAEGLPQANGYDEASPNSTYCHSWKMRLESDIEFGAGPCSCTSLSTSGVWCYTWSCQQAKAPRKPYFWIYLVYSLIFAIYAFLGLCYLAFEYIFLAPPSRLRPYACKPTTWILEGLALCAGMLTWINVVVCYQLLRGAQIGAQNGYYSLLWALVVVPWCLLLSWLLHIGMRSQIAQPRRFDDDRIRLWHLLANMMAVCAAAIVALVCTIGNLGAVVGGGLFVFALLLCAALQPLSAARTSNAAAATCDELQLGILLMPQQKASRKLEV